MGLHTATEEAIEVVSRAAQGLVVGEVSLHSLFEGDEKATWMDPYHRLWLREVT